MFIAKMNEITSFFKELNTKAQEQKTDKNEFLNFFSPDDETIGDTFTPLAPTYKWASYNNKERAAGNGKIDEDAVQGHIGDCGLLSALRALRNSEGGQKALDEIMSYDAVKGTWSFNFKTKDFDGTNPIIVTKDEVNEAIAIERVSKGDDDVSAMELAVKKYLEQIGASGTKDNTMASIKKIQDNARAKMIAAGAEDKGVLDGINPYIGYIFTGNMPKNTLLYDTSKLNEVREILYNFDKTTDMLIFSQIIGENTPLEKQKNGLTLVTIGDDQMLANHAYTVCDVEGDNVFLRESNNPGEVIVVTKDELLNHPAKNYLTSYSYGSDETPAA